jgi:hypothetical protein
MSPELTTSAHRAPANPRAPSPQSNRNHRHESRKERVRHAQEADTDMAVVCKEQVTHIEKGVGFGRRPFVSFKFYNMGDVMHSAKELQR